MQITRLESVWVWWMLHHSVCNDIRRMCDVFVGCFEMYLVNETFAAKSQETAAGDECVTPVGEALDWSVQCQQ